MSATEQGLTFRGRFDVARPASWSAAVNAAVDEFHQRTCQDFNQVQDLNLMAAYAKERGWPTLAKTLLEGDQ